MGSLFFLVYKYICSLQNLKTYKIKKEYLKFRCFISVSSKNYKTYIIYVRLNKQGFLSKLNKSQWNDFKSLVNVYNQFNYVNNNVLKVRGHGNNITFNKLKNLIAYIRNTFKSNCEIQRYKGLGEMNPSQLWNTTMNPKNRILSKMNIRNTSKTNKIFSRLMGEVVKERRDFVQTSDLYITKFNI